MRKVTKLWTTKSGEKIRICDMSDDHLKNTIGFLERAAKKMYEREIDACMSISFQGEQAQYEQDRFLSTADEEDYLHPLYEDLRAELLRRT